MNTQSILTALGLALPFLAARAAVLSGPILNPANNHHYYLLARTNSVAAEAEAFALGGHLVTINNAQENAWVHQVFSASNGMVWLGLHRSPTNAFIWQSGEPLLFSNWASGEPNNQRGDEYYAVMYQTNSGFGPAGAWNDTPGDFMAAYGIVNPYAVVEVPEPLVVGPAGWIRWEPASGGNGHLYRAVASTNLMTWLTASNLAALEGGHLATLTTPEENAFVFSLVDSPEFWNRPFGPVLGGFQKTNSPEPAGGWCWITGEPWSYTSWFPGQPDNFPNEGWLHFYSGDPNLRQPMWNDIPITERIFRGYVAERDDDPAHPLVFISSAVQMCWITATNLSYQVEWTTAADSAQWFSLGLPQRGTGSTLCAFDTLQGGPRRIYRIRVTPE